MDGAAFEFIPRAKKTNRTIRHSPELPVHIYALVDPRDNSIRYVGVTTNLEERYFAHLGQTEATANKREWMKSLRAEGLAPRMFVIETTTGKHAQEDEKWWVAELESDGHPLLNAKMGSWSRKRSA